MAPDPSTLRSDEYAALRATIRERGTLRLSLIVLTFVAWAALVVASAPPTGPLLSLVTLLVLAAGFEAVFATHVGVERIGRYIQHRYEVRDPSAGPGWEHLAMALGRAGASSPVPGPDPLAQRLFLLATLLNLLASGLLRPGSGPSGLAMVVVLAAHGMFVWRLFRARRLAASQRERDLTAIESVRTD